MMDLEFLFNQNKTKSLHGRYITLNEIVPILKTLDRNDNLTTIGKSVLGKPIYQYCIGKGKIKILLWSQMHGNESTTTKALFDFLQLINSNSDLAEQILNDFTFCCLPLLNPDGAEAYTRENANNIDLNRDFQALSQPESQLLMQVFKDFSPNYCYNLHDQRTIYGAGTTGKPATVSFLAPSYNESRDYNSPRIEACRIINAMTDTLEGFISGQIGRFDDAFNNNCCGDSFQQLGVPTILFESGHYPGDYNREIVRKYIFIALMSSLKAIQSKNDNSSIIDKYLEIPHNKVNFHDILIKNIQIYEDNKKNITNIAIQFKETLINNQIHFIAEIVNQGQLEDYFGHLIIDAENQLFSSDYIFELNKVADFTVVNKIEFIKGKLSHIIIP